MGLPEIFVITEKGGDKPLALVAAVDGSCAEGAFRGRTGYMNQVDVVALGTMILDDETEGIAGEA